MWQDIIVYSIVALGAGITLWNFITKFSRQGSCCSGGCACKQQCGSRRTGGELGKHGPESRGCSPIG